MPSNFDFHLWNVCFADPVLAADLCRRPAGFVFRKPALAVVRLLSGGYALPKSGGERSGQAAKTGKPMLVILRVTVRWWYPIWF